MYDIDHAMNNPLAVHYYDDYVMVIGPDRSGDLLEVGINNDENVFHAMPARKKFLRRK
ncbi:MAG: hypothetical protein Q4C87_02335 [Actinomycetaceae bacterium]|nr:hypothetical protein [Actinomycetaceae bacterium]